MTNALVFDFDGLILDTETPLYEAWRFTFDEVGLEPISFDDWSRSLGLADDDPNMLDPSAIVRAHLRDDGALEEANRRRRAYRNDLMASLSLQPGVLELLDEADRRGIPAAIASSSTIDWVGPHLDRHGIAERFRFVSCVVPGVPGKPHPATYLNACDALGVAPATALALEDSPNGTTAAKAAGLRCVSVPAGVSKSLDFSHADHTVSSLLDLDLDELPWH